MSKELNISEYHLRVILFDGSLEQILELQSLYKYIQRGPRDTFAGATLTILKDWVENKKDDDYELFERMGVTEDTFKEMLDKVLELRNLIVLPMNTLESDEFDVSMNIDYLAVVYYKSVHDKILDIVAEIESIVDEGPKQLKTRKVLARHETIFYDATEIMVVPNPYIFLPRLISEINDAMDYYDRVEIDFDTISYTPQFQFLEKFIPNIENKNFEEEEKDILIYNWYLFVLHGFIYSQVFFEQRGFKISLNKKEKIELTSEEELLKDNIGYVSNVYQSFKKNLDDFQEDELNYIYNSHKNDESGEFMKPLIENLIPYFKNIRTDKELIRLILQQSEKYGSIVNKQRENYKYSLAHASKNAYKIGYIEYVHYIQGCYCETLDFKLIDPPDDSYLPVLNRCIEEYFYSTSKMWLNGHLEYEDIRVLKCNKYLDPENNLQNQKYYAVWIMVNETHKYESEKISNDKQWLACVILSLLPWKLNYDFDEARELESKIKENLAVSIKNYQFFENDSLFKFWDKYVQNTLLKATKPLDPESIHNALIPSNDGGCCSIF